jgi:hypothetical protein
MRVTLDRLPDHEWAHVLIERDDRVVYRMQAGPVTADLPHDLVHFTVEDALGMADGIWGMIAGGVVFRSMTHVSGRRPPHAAERSAALIRQYRDRIQRAELIGGFVEAAAHQPDAVLARLAARAFRGGTSDLPNLEALGAAVTAVRRAEIEWRQLPIGGQQVLDWPAHRRLTPTPARRSREKVSTRRPR